MLEIRKGTTDMLKKRYFCIVIALICVTFNVNSQDIQVTSNQTAQQLWEAFCKDIPPGVTVNSVSVTFFAMVQEGTYRNCPPISGVAVKDGIVLTSGYADSVPGPNSRGGCTGQFGYPGDADINAAVGALTMDACVFEVNFTSDNTIPGFSFTFFYGTEEWVYYQGSDFNDAFICLHNGNNICFDNNNNIISVNSAFFGVSNIRPDNPEWSGSPYTNLNPADYPYDSINLQYDGFTSVLRTSWVISPGTHTLKFAVADVSKAGTDAILDCGVFLSDFKFDTTINGTTPVVNIIENQLFTIPEQTSGGTTIGTITNLCKYGPISLLKLNNVPEFYLNGWDIVVSNGMIFNASVTDEYTLAIEATLDTIWDGKTWIVHDTADMTIKLTNDNQWPQIDSAVIYDRNGNGIGDSICVKLKYDFPLDYTLSKADFSWPSGQTDYSINISNGNLAGSDIIAFSYDPGNGAPVWTYGQDTVEITIDSAGGSDNSMHSGNLEDGIGPVLEGAFVVKRYVPQADTFRVRISEPVNVFAITGNSFILIKGNHIKEIEITPIGAVTDLGGESYIKFLVADLLADAPAQGDSLKILHTGPVIDKKNNQAHKDNPPVPIKFVGSYVPVKNAYYYDLNADGIVDNVRIEFVDTVKSIDSITFDVSWTDISASASDVNASYGSNVMEILLDLNNVFGNNNNINYKTSGDMSLTLTYVSTGNTATHTVVDLAAPVIVSAQYYSFNSSTTNDTLIVSFSEKMSIVNDNNPFKFWSPANPSYLVTVSDVTTDSNTVTFYAVNFPDGVTPTAGDSIWIFADHDVMDVLGVEQMVDANRKQPLSVYSAFSVQSAVYLETDARPDGYIDLIRVTLNAVPAIFDFTSLASSIGLPADRYFNALNSGSFTATASGFDISVVQSRTSIPFDQVNTAVDADDKLIISSSTAIGNNTVLLPASVAITDSLGPVVVSGMFCPKAETNNPAMYDTLIATFSEEVKVPSVNQPFRFFDITGIFAGGYSMTLTPLSTTQGKVLTFLVDNTEKAYPQNGDSLWIIGGNNVEDIVSIVQTKDTKPAPLTVKPYPLILSITVLNPVQLSNPAIHSNLVNRYDLENNNSGCLVIVEISGHIENPEKLSGALNILDAVGNNVREGIKSNYVKYFDKNNKEHNALTMVWDLHNRNSRLVGPATYCGTIVIKNGNTVLEQKRVLIGVKY